MKIKLLSLSLGAAACIAFAVARLVAQNSPTAKAPETSKILFENDRSRVIEYHTHAGKNICGLGMHSHPAHVYIMLTDAKLRVTTPDGKEEIVEAKAGETGWEPAVIHRAENLSGNNAGCYLIEFKDQEWKPSTGLSPANEPAR
jgi:hypothetical protein